MICGSVFSQSLNSRIATRISTEEQAAANIISSVDTGSVFKIMACVAAANDNFANATALVVNGGNIAGTTCGTLEAGETTACNTGAGLQTVWYKFTATSTTHFVQIAYTAGACYFGTSIYSGSSLPTSACTDKPINCQSSAYGPLTQLYQLTSLTIGAVYYIQVVYPAGGACGSNGNFNIQVTTANPGGTITNPAYINTCATNQPGCFFNSPPSVNTVTSTCTSYPLAAAGYSANSVFSLYQTFTSSPSWSNFSWQAIITSNCGLGGNVNWLNWTLFNCSCGIIGCGDISTLTGSGLACGTCYILMYQFELANCSSFTNVWPYQNVPASPTPCTVLPLELLYYIGNFNSADNSVKLEWETAQEVNVKEFIVERSEDGFNYVEIAKVGASGKSNSYNKYSATDPSRLSNAVYYYKLREIETDGKEHFSKVIAIAVENGEQLMRFAPNPAQDYFDIIFTSKSLKQTTRLEVYNNFGQKVMEENFIPENQLKHIDISAFTSGLYIINITTPASSKVIRQTLIKE